MNSIDKIYYKNSKKRCKKLSNEKLIMETLHTLLNDVNDLKDRYLHHKDSSITEALKDELRNRINKE